ncbi:siderophore-interacting protein [Pseudomonas sp. F1_0610]|uniref:siderophore-interacting protein n=1 Tax=Pseudomonas sp. F1_0610 TaxID=3114284 RepID=UPI0039C3363F
MPTPRPHQCVISVQDKQFITPNYLRIVFNCPDATHYKDTPIGDNNKLFIPPQGQKEVQLPTFDFENRRWLVEDESKRPTVRTYTHRAIDLDKQQITIDFAIHEGDSIACSWARNSKIGDQIGVTMQVQARKTLPEVDNYLFVTDPTGLPVTAAFLENLAPEARAYVIAEVPTEQDFLPMPSAADVTIEWVVNPHPEQGSPLYERVKQLNPALLFENGTRYAHITAEYSTIRNTRNYLRKELGWTRDECYACSYWQIGKTEDKLGKKVMDD